jgi:hypothetical protein
MMSAPAPPGLLERLAALERAVRDLQARIAQLEQRNAASPEHPVDVTATRQKAVYDWQGPR